jgi:hypothetical protein
LRCLVARTAAACPARAKSHALGAVGPALVARDFDLRPVAAAPGGKRRELARASRKLDGYEVLLLAIWVHPARSRGGEGALYLARRLQERRSIRLTSNIVLGQWDRILGDPAATPPPWNARAPRRAARVRRRSHLVSERSSEPARHRSVSESRVGASAPVVLRRGLALISPSTGPSCRVSLGGRICFTALDRQNVIVGHRRQNLTRRTAGWFSFGPSWRPHKLPRSLAKWRALCK